jgi:hypothetical protein
VLLMDDDMDDPDVVLCGFHRARQFDLEDCCSEVLEWSAYSAPEVVAGRECIFVF